MHYIVIESGRHQLSSGKVIEAGKGMATTSRTKQSFSRGFSKVPVVLAMPQTDNEADAVVMHISSVTSSSFTSRMVEQEKGGNIGSKGSHAPEALGYIAIEQGFAKTDGLTMDVKRTSPSITEKMVYD